MNLDEYAIDDLHQCSLAEFADDDAAQQSLNAAYRAARMDYIALLLSLREKARRERTA